MEHAEVDINSCRLIKEWTKIHRPQVEPDHQIERYAWFRDNIKGDIISIGCGEAKVEEYMYIDAQGICDYNQPVCGLDINLVFVKLAGKRWVNGRFLHKDITKDFSPMQYNSYDTVIIGDMIEHIRPVHFHRVLSEALRFLKPNGHVLMTTPNGGYFGDNNSSSIYSSDHYFILTGEVLENLLNPSDRKWWLDSGTAMHQFRYIYKTVISKSQRFWFVDIQWKE